MKPQAGTPRCTEGAVGGNTQPRPACPPAPSEQPSVLLATPKGQPGQTGSARLGLKALQWEGSQPHRSRDKPQQEAAKLASEVVPKTPGPPPRETASPLCWDGFSRCISQAPETSTHSHPDTPH